MNLAERFELNRSDFYETDGLIEHLAHNGQAPHSLIMTCMDSRVSLFNLFGLMPGESLVLRSAGPLIPIFDDTCSASQVFHENLLLAINDMKIKSLCLLGHTGCGAAGKLSSNIYNSGDIPWMKKVAGQIMQNAMNIAGDSNQGILATEIEKQIIIQGIKNLFDYPVVMQAIREGRLTVEGLQFDIHNGRLLKLIADGRDFHFEIVAGPAKGSLACDGAHEETKKGARA